MDKNQSILDSMMKIEIKVEKETKEKTDTLKNGFIDVFPLLKKNISKEEFNKRAIESDALVDDYFKKINGK